MASSLIDVPAEAEVISQIIEKTLQNGMLVEVYLVKYPRQYESALFINGITNRGLRSRALSKTPLQQQPTGWAYALKSV